MLKTASLILWIVGVAAGRKSGGEPVGVCPYLAPSKKGGSATKVKSVVKSKVSGAVYNIVNENDGPTSVYDVTPNSLRKPSSINKMSQGFQLWAIRHPKNVFSKLFLPIVELVEGGGGSAVKADEMREKFGNNFCFCGAVVMSSFEDVKTALLEPQARGWRLGRWPHKAANLPKGQEGRNLYLLALSQKGAGGDGLHEAVRSAVKDTIIKDGVKRQKDPTSRLLLDELALEYKAKGGNKRTSTFWTDPNAGYDRFLIRYLNYVLLGVNPLDDAKIAILSKFYSPSRPLCVGYYLKVLNKIVSLAKNFPKLIKQVVDIYVNSPALVNFVDGQEKYMGLTKEEVAQAVIPVIAIAGMQGPTNLIKTCVGQNDLLYYVRTPKDRKGFDQTRIWKNLNMNNDAEVERYIFECGRHKNPVTATHYVATQDFKCKIGSRYYTFPKGTIIDIPISLAMMNEDAWGPTSYVFDHTRKNIVERSMIFNSFGSKTNGRICPGRMIALNLCKDLLKTLGKSRDEMGVW